MKVGMVFVLMLIVVFECVCMLIVFVFVRFSVLLSVVFVSGFLV